MTKGTSTRRSRNTGKTNMINSMPNISLPAASSKQVFNVKPSFKATSKGQMVRHRELLATIVNSTTFSVVNGLATNTYAVNPVQPSTFPWLHTLALSYDKFQIHKLKLHYIPIVGSNVSGRVALFHDPDSQDLGPYDRTELGSYECVAETAPWSSVTLSIKTDNVIRFVDDVSSSDVRLVDFGRVGFVSYAGADNSTGLGDVFIEYEIELINPQPPSTLIGAINGTASSASSVQPLSYVSSVTTGSNNIAFGLYPGTYYLNFNSNCNITVTGITCTITGNASTSGNVYLVSNANRASASAVVTISDSTGRVTYTITGGSYSDWQLNMVRSNRAYPMTL